MASGGQQQVQGDYCGAAQQSAAIDWGVVRHSGRAVRANYRHSAFDTRTRSFGDLDWRGVPLQPELARNNGAS